MDDYEPGQTFSRLDVCLGMKRNVTELAYVVDAFQNGDGQAPLQVLCGSSCSARPCLRLLEVGGKKKKLKPLADLADPATVTRCAVWDEPAGVLYSGGEDGTICKWKRK